MLLAGVLSFDGWNWGAAALRRVPIVGEGGCPFLKYGTSVVYFLDAFDTHPL